MHSLAETSPAATHGASGHNRLMGYVHAVLVALAAVAGMVLAVIVTAAAYRTWSRDAPCQDLIVKELNDTRSSACLAATAPWWLLVAVGLTVGVGSAWSIARFSRRLTSSGN